MRPKLRRLLKRGRARDGDNAGGDNAACFGEEGAAPAPGARARSPSLLHPLSVLPPEAAAAAAAATGGSGGGSSSSGAVLLRRLVASLRGSTHDDGAARRGVHGGGVWHYAAGQGSLPADLARLRATLDPRLYRTGGVLVGGGWARLLLGDQYAPGRPRPAAGVHFLHVTLTYCTCVSCAAAEAAAEQDVPDLPQSLSALQALEGFAPDESPPVSPGAVGDGGDEAIEPGPPAPAFEFDSTVDRVDQASIQAEEVPLPSPRVLSTLSAGAAACEQELGWITRGSRSPKVRMCFTAQCGAMFQQYPRYAGPLPAASMSAEIMKLAAAYFLEHPKSKSERKVYIQGRLFRFAVVMGVHPAGSNAAPQPHPVTGQKQQPLGVVFKRQMLVLFHGKIALETGIGTFLTSDESYYLGFGEDPHGAQTVFRDGELGPARYLGFNEMLVHIPFKRLERTEIIMR